MDLSIMEKVIVQGDLSVLKPDERLIYYTKVCESVGLNPLTKPFDYLKLDGKLVLYAKRDATDQLRKLHSISITITSRERIGDVYCVTARGVTPENRADESIGAVSLMKEEKIWDEMRRCKVATGRILPLTADELANAIMKAETKAKRRVTLSLSGLGMMDESEIDTVENAERIIVNDEVTGNQLQEKAKTSAKSSKVNKPEQATNTSSTSQLKKEQVPTANDTYRLLDFDTGTSPGGVTFAKLKVANVSTGEESVMIANTPETLDQVNTISNNSEFKIHFDILNGFKIVKSVMIVGEAA
ncbi:hypothetical protein UY286_05015 [Paenibacillus polymyxa]|uniref:hypothetical protein n=1 Tax=Paenibacillus polymyxa TaxID=1406 RepID=UPI002AB4E2E3|nr:hypothetical protein [Paenibacillus polymyxa]MDY7989845.1 hypothetical protein [Paenibacillus polymyxa]MDY8116796.1 hypothetical protein [Paenibacillus polymyxa]